MRWRANLVQASCRVTTWRRLGLHSGRSGNDDHRQCPPKATSAPRCSPWALVSAPPRALRRHALGPLLQSDRAAGRELPVLLRLPVRLDRHQRRPHRDRLLCDARRRSMNARTTQVASTISVDAAPLATVNSQALAVFFSLFVLVTLIGFVASRWRQGDLDQLHEWG